MNILFIQGDPANDQFNWLAGLGHHQIDRRQIDDVALEASIADADLVVAVASVSFGPRWVALCELMAHRGIPCALIEMMSSARLARTQWPEGCALKAPAGIEVELHCAWHERRLTQLSSLMGGEGLCRGTLDDGAGGRVTRFEFQGD